ncbi:MAG TPA: hypothetical protein VGP08_00160 [Pyrinomonadaceae bacterium]|jgi:hypothetical protein|nr:hypothetical protein [Pyrinomonadaceae bacterium]
MTNEEIDRAFFGAYSNEFLADLIRLISSKCKEAVEECSVFRPKRAKALFPILRRTQIDENIEVLAEDYPEIEAEVRDLSSNNCITELRRDYAVLTVHKVISENSKVRPAIQREMLAQSSQVSLFDNRELPPDDAILYAQLKYGVARRFPKELAFVVVDFPDKAGNIVRSIPLLALPQFSSLLDEGKKEPKIENIEDNLNLGLRSDAFNKGRKSGTGDPQQGPSDANGKIDLNEDDKDNDDDSDDGNKVG